MQYDDLFTFVYTSSGRRYAKDANLQTHVLADLLDVNVTVNEALDVITGHFSCGPVNASFVL